MTERVDRRVLGAVRFFDRVSEAEIARNLRVEIAGARLVRNLSGMWVITRVEGVLAAISDTTGSHDAFAAQTLPQGVALQSEPFNLTITDPLYEFLPRTATIRLPRDGDPAHRADPGSLFNAQHVFLYPAPTARARGHCASLRVSITRTVQGKSSEARGVVVRVVQRNDAERELGLGVSSERGEALVLLPALPLTTFADVLGADDDVGAGVAPVTTPDTSARVDVFFDPDASWPLDPEAIASVPANLRTTFDLSLQAGREQKRSVELAL